MSQVPSAELREIRWTRDREFLEPEVWHLSARCSWKVCGTINRIATVTIDRIAAITIDRIATYLFIIDFDVCAMFVEDLWTLCGE